MQGNLLVCLMPLDFVILSNDQVMFDVGFSPAIIVPVPGVITGSAQALSNGVMACVTGDEASVQVPGVAYTSGAFVTPGVGLVTILALGGDQQAQQGTSGGRPYILKGSTFQAKLQVLAPAINPSSGVPDPVPIYFGSGQFMTANMVFKAA